ncbi:MAG: hypothetical protein NZM25_06175 [Leptospiraceae bacterium]|nr:hypothetical protein [Leptospiraceae bacterium]MDW8306638.1 hypothetical protein [Leptospiraceae bacterium]
MPDFNHPLFLRLLLFLVVSGAGISLISSLLAGAMVSTIITRLFLYSLLMAFLAALLFSALHYFVPEVLDILAKPSEEILEKEEEAAITEEDIPPAEESFAQESLKKTEDFSFNERPESRVKIKGKNQNLGDELIVQGVRIPNNPDLMADAIRDTLEKDRE